MHANRTILSFYHVKFNLQEIFTEKLGNLGNLVIQGNFSSSRPLPGEICSLIMLQRYKQWLFCYKRLIYKHLCNKCDNTQPIGRKIRLDFDGNSDFLRMLASFSGYWGLLMVRLIFAGSGWFQASFDMF